MKIIMAREIDALQGGGRHQGGPRRAVASGPAHGGLGPCATGCGCSACAASRPPRPTTTSRPRRRRWSRPPRATTTRSRRRGRSRAPPAASTRSAACALPAAAAGAREHGPRRRPGPQGGGGGRGAGQRRRLWRLAHVAGQRRHGRAGLRLPRQGGGRGKTYLPGQKTLRSVRLLDACARRPPGGSGAPRQTRRSKASCGSTPRRPRARGRLGGGTAFGTAILFHVGGTYLEHQAVAEYARSPGSVGGLTSSIGMGGGDGAAARRVRVHRHCQRRHVCEAACSARAVKRGEGVEKSAPTKEATRGPEPASCTARRKER